MAKGEFENREAEELGDLPEDLGIERGDMDRVSLSPPAGPMFPEMQSAARARRQLQSTGLGAPEMDFSVRSVYDSRPVNARDFNYWAKVTGSGEGNPPVYTVLNRCFYTPRGFVTCIRRVSFLSQAVVAPPTVTARLRLLVDEAAVDPPTLTIGPTADNGGDTISAAGIGIPVGMEGSFDTFTLVDEGHWVGVDLQWTTDPVNPAGYQTYIGFYGQFLYKTGVPAMFQAANTGGSGRARTAKTIPAGSAVGQQSLTPEVTLARRRRRDPFAGVPHVNDPRFRKR